MTILRLGSEVAWFAGGHEEARAGRRRVGERVARGRSGGHGKGSRRVAERISRRTSVSSPWVVGEAPLNFSTHPDNPTTNASGWFTGQWVTDAYANRVLVWVNTTQGHACAYFSEPENYGGTVEHLDLFPAGTCPESPVTTACLAGDVHWTDSEAFSAVPGFAPIPDPPPGACIGDLPEADDAASAVVSNTAEHRIGTMTVDCSEGEWSATSTSCTATHCPATAALSPWTGADGASCDDDGGGQLPESVIGVVDTFEDTVAPTTGEASVACVADPDSPSIAAWEYDDPDAACNLPPISDLQRCTTWHPHQHPALAPLVNYWHKNIQHSGIPGLSFTRFHSGGDAMIFRVNGPDGLGLRVGYEYRDGANRHHTDSVDHVVGQSGVSFVSGTQSDGSPYPGPVDTFQLWESGKYSSTAMFWAKTAADEHACVYVYHEETHSNSGGEQCMDLLSDHSSHVCDPGTFVPFDPTNP